MLQITILAQKSTQIAMNDWNGISFFENFIRAKNK